MKKLVLSLLSGLLLAFSWPEIGVFPFIFFSFLPLFVLEGLVSNSDINKKGVIIFLYSFLSFLVFNIITTYWIYHSTLFGAAIAFIINSLLMATVFWLFYNSRRILGNRLGYLSFIFFWIGMEYLHLNWDLAWPWLTLGNVFSSIPSFVQWYEFTGVLGGSLIVLLSNLLVFRFWKSKMKRDVILLTFILSVSFLSSWFLMQKEEDNSSMEFEVVIVQPNIDPYKDKFALDYQHQLESFINLAKESLTDNTRLLVGPETVLQEVIWESEIDSSYSIYCLRNLQEEFPKLSILVGASTYKSFNVGEDITSTARKFKYKDGYYDVYNSAVFLSYSGDVKIYHKTRLVPGAEKIPFPYFLNNISSLSVNLGGVSGSLGSSNSTYIFSVNETIIQPLICYESVFGEISSYQHSDLLCVITNDGWWKETAGYKQHFVYSRLRAIEQRTPIVRSANTGISGIISSYGEDLLKTKWNQEDSVKQKINLTRRVTIYNQYGDYIGRLASFISVLLLILMIVRYKLSSRVILH